MSVSNYLLHTHSIQTTESSNPIGLRIKISKATHNLTMLNIFLNVPYPIPIGPLKILTNMSNPMTHLSASSLKITKKKLLRPANPADFCRK